MSAPRPGELRARARLGALLFRKAMPRLAAALAAKGLGPPRPEEKERLLARLEEAAWSLPGEVFEGCDDEAWEERVPDHPQVEALLDAAARGVVDARPPK